MTISVTEMGLKRVGVTMVSGPDHLTLKCDTCGSIWLPNLLPGGRLPNCWWKCPTDPAHTIENRNHKRGRPRKEWKIAEVLYWDWDGPTPHPLFPNLAAAQKACSDVALEFYRYVEAKMQAEGWLPGPGPAKTSELEPREARSKKPKEIEPDDY